MIIAKKEAENLFGAYDETISQTTAENDDAGLIINDKLVNGRCSTCIYSSRSFIEC